MTLSTIVAMVISLGIPLLVTLVTKTALSAPWKQLILLFFTTVTGVVTSLLGTLPTSLNGWEHLLLNVLMAYLAAAVAYLISWKPTGVIDALSRSTKDFGIGPSNPPANAIK